MVKAALGNDREVTVQVPIQRRMDLSSREVSIPLFSQI